MGRTGAGLWQWVHREGVAGIVAATRRASTARRRTLTPQLTPDVFEDVRAALDPVRHSQATARARRPDRPCDPLTRERTRRRTPFANH
jgi:hypothetical protein